MKLDRVRVLKFLVHKSIFALTQNFGYQVFENKMLVKITNSEGPYQTAPAGAVCSVPALFARAKFLANV